MNLGGGMDWADQDPPSSILPVWLLRDIHMFGCVPPAVHEIESGVAVGVCQ